MKFSNKTILIVSQQDWGMMFISKHHYALALSRMGNKVYFLNSPSSSASVKSGDVVIEPTEFDDLYEINHKFYYPYLIKHKAKALHRALLKKHVQKIIKKIGRKVDVVWSFDISDTVSLRSFPNSVYKIFMPVDEPAIPTGVDAAISSDVIFSVTNEILDKYRGLNIPSLFTNHGVSGIFFKKNEYRFNDNNINVALSGNFLRPDIDWVCLLQIINAHPNVVFNFFGPTAGDQSNLSDERSSGVGHPDLTKVENVKLHGSVAPEKLADELHRMDAFLICYDIDKDQSGGTNYHKVLEYMATGRVIISNNITTYSQMVDLIEMPEERNNDKLPKLFSKVMMNLEDYNSIEKQMVRIKYANEHTYENNITTIENFITKTQKRA